MSSIYVEYPSTYCITTAGFIIGYDICVILKIVF